MTMWLNRWATVVCTTMALANGVAMAQPDVENKPKRTGPPTINVTELPETRRTFRLLAPNGEPVAMRRMSASIIVRGDLGRIYLNSRTDAEGKIQLKGPAHPTLATVYVRVDGVGCTLRREIAFEKNDFDIFDLTLQPGNTLQVSAHENTTDGQKGRVIGAASIQLQIHDAIEAGGDRDDQQANPIYVPVREHTLDGDGIGTVKHLVPGRYTILIDSLDYHRVRQEVEIKDRQTTAVDVSLERAVLTDLKVTLLYPDGTPLANTEWSVEIVPADASPYTGPTTRRFVTNEKGEATLYPVRAGIYNLLPSGDYTIAETRVDVTQKNRQVVLTATKLPPREAR